MSDMDLYSYYFPAGKKVGVGIPLSNAEVFKDWAVIHSIDEDLVSLQLSRDVLPVNVSLYYGQILELRGGSGGNGFCCRAIVVSEGDARELLIRLIGEVVSDELREFYRIDAFLPIKYFVSFEQDIDLLRKQWEERRIRRELLEIDRKDQRWTGRLSEPERERPRHLLETTGDEKGPDQNRGGGMASDSWDAIIPLAANISGGGMRINTRQEFEDGEYILLEIFVPVPPRVVDVVGRVVFANRTYPAGSDREYLNTGVQFVYIDERDRDAIVRYISTIQLKRIRQLREKYLLLENFESDEPATESGWFGLRKPVALAISVLFLLSLLTTFASYFWKYAHEHPKAEIQRIFEEGVKKYRDRLQQN
ncbi:MAG: DUF5634 family protein [Geobacteraceae bacterium]|nr:DUF5634 family protein [Geobacteraceae bacterium]